MTGGDMKIGAMIRRVLELDAEWRSRSRAIERLEYFKAVSLEMARHAPVLASRLLDALTVLAGAAAQFRHYEQLHLGKKTSDAGEKAATNQAMAEFCEEALRGADGWEPIDTHPGDSDGVLVAFMNAYPPWGTMAYFRPDNPPTLTMSAWQMNNGQGFDRVPTHWRRFPPLPAGRAA